MNKIHKIKENLEKHLLKQFKIYPEKSKVKVYNLPDWITFGNSRGTGAYTPGLYTMIDNTSHLLDCPEIAQTLFHEHFGHGLYSEHTQTGRELTRLMQEAKKEETAANPRTSEELRNFRATNTTIQRLIDEKTKHYPEREGFAVWMQHYLSNITGRQGEFKKTLRKASEHLREITEKLIRFSASYGEHALLYDLGFPKHYNKEIIKNLLQRIYPANDIKLALLYGSRKPHSDIDIFIVSDRIKREDCEWLDISSVDVKLFEDLVSKLDISVTDPLFTGETILGDERYLEQTQKKILSLEITPEQIKYHKQHAEKAKQIALNAPTPKHSQTAMRYNWSYLANAKELEKGRKALTLKQLMNTHHLNQ
ncbi:MAG: nucleotidyltransferase domain-containing protein [archaeon]